MSTQTFTVTIVSPGGCEARRCEIEEMIGNYYEEASVSVTLEELPTLINDQPITPMPEFCGRWDCMNEHTVQWPIQPIDGYWKCPHCEGSYGAVT